MALFILLLVSIFNYLDRTIISILQVPIKRELGLSDGQLGALTGLAFALFYSTLGVPIARLADRFNRKYIIAASLALWSGMTACSGFAVGFISLVSFRAGVALGEAGSIPASHSILADNYPPHRRATALGIWGMALPIGVMLGYLSGGWLAQAIDWRWALWIIGVLGLLLVPVVLLWLKEPPRGRYDVAAPVETAKWSDGLRRIASTPSLLLLFAGGALNNFELSIALNWNAPFYTRVHHLGLGEAASALALMSGIGGGIGILAGGWLTDRVGNRQPHYKPILVGLVLLAVTPMAMLQYTTASPGLSLAAGAASIAFLFFYYAPIIALCHSVVPPSIRAFTSSILLLTVSIVGLGLGPWLAGLLSDHLGQGPQALRQSMTWLSLSCLGAGGCFLLAARYYPRDLARLENGA